MKSRTLFKVFVYGLAVVALVSGVVRVVAFNGPSSNAGAGGGALGVDASNDVSIGTSTTHVLIGGLYALPFDLLNDLAPIAELAAEPLLIVARKSLPVRNLTEFSVAAISPLRNFGSRLFAVSAARSRTREP